MIWIILGVGFIPSILLNTLFIFLGWSKDKDMGVFMIAFFGFGLLLEFISSIERDKTNYNEEIERRKQMNLFRDFGVK